MARGSRRSCWARFTSLSFPPSRTASAWGCPSVVPSPRPMGAGYGRRTILPAGGCSSSPCRSRRSTVAPNPAASRITALMPAIVQTVFILDDDVSFCRALERLLRALGYRVQAFQSAFEFFAHWSPEQAGCLLLDLRMPDLNGLEVQRRLAGLEPELPIIFVSGQADVPSCVSAMRNGATDILLKPFQEEELVE